MKLRRVRIHDPKTGRTKYKFVNDANRPKPKVALKRRGIVTEKDEYDIVAAAKYLGLATQTLYNRKNRGDPPEWFKRGHRIYYKLSDLQAFDRRRTKKRNHFFGD